MESKNNTPTMEQVADFLKSYGWNYREVTGENDQKIIIAPYMFETKKQAVYVSFRVEGEFVIISTVGLLSEVPKERAGTFLSINDTIKLVKVFTINPPDAEKLEIEVGFELWAESWEKNTFFSFMDMCCLGIEKVMSQVESENIAHVTRFVALTAGE